MWLCKKKKGPLKTKKNEGLSPAVNNNFEMSTTIVVIGDCGGAKMKF